MHDYAVVFCCRVLEIFGIDELIKSKNIIDLGLIRDIANPMDKEARCRVEMIAEMFRLSGHPEP